MLSECKLALRITATVYDAELCSLMDAAAISSRFYNQCMMRFTGEKIVRGNPYALGDPDLGPLSVGGRYVPGQKVV